MFDPTDYDPHNVLSIQKARKEHDCICGNKITVGEVYYRRAIPPWLQGIQDYDEEGKVITVAENTGHWMVDKLHDCCMGYAGCEHFKEI